MPDHAALTGARAVKALHPIQGGFDDEILLIAGNLPDPSIKNRKPPRQFQEPFGTAKGEQSLVLLTHQSIAGQGFRLDAKGGCHFGDDLPGKGPVDHGCQFLELALAAGHPGLFPDPPEFCGGSRRGVHGAVFIQGQHHLAVDEELRDIVVTLISDRLRNGLFHPNLRRFTLHHAKRNAIDEQNDIRPCGLR